MKRKKSSRTPEVHASIKFLVVLVLGTLLSITTCASADPLTGPVANFTANQTIDFAPFIVQFTDLSENATAWSWDFGDGTTSSDQNPTHTYYVAGNYTVNLTVSNVNGTDSKTAMISVSAPQFSHSGGPDNYNYTFKDSDTVGGPTYDWIEISETGNQILNNSDDAVQDNVDLGFFFSYYGTNYSRLTISNNGLLFSSGSGFPGNEPIGQSPNVHGFISPFWDDLVTYNGGKIYYQTLGTAPNRIFVTEWVDNQHYPSSDSEITFESILYEGSNNIKFQYKNVSFGNTPYGTSSQFDNGGSATVGIESPEGTDGLQYSFNTQVITPGKAILFMCPQFIDPLPIANFRSNVASGTAPLDIQFTDLSKHATLLNWDFGDGTNSTEQNPAHTYSTAGNYTVNLTAINVNGIDSKLATINVLKQTPSIYWYTPADITYGTALSAIQLNAMAINPNTGAIIDGTFVYTPAAGTVVLSPGTQTLHVDFTPTDTVSYNTASADVPINVNLVLANFTANQTIGFAPLSVQFTDLSENAEAVAWDFGDGTYSTEQNPIHEFTTPGTYAINLIASNGTDIDSKFATINVLNVVSHSGGPDNFKYTFKDSDTVGGPTYDWIEISGTGTQVLSNTDDAVQDNVDLGFFFSYYGTNYSRLAISSNGLLFYSGATTQFANEPIGQSPGVHGFIAPFWDDLVTYNGGTVYYQTLGTSPNRIFVTEWVDTKPIGISGQGLTFESILYEGSNNIKFQYKDVDSENGFYDTSYVKGGSATVGIESPEGTDGLQYSFNEQAIDSGKAILFMCPQFNGALPIANFRSNVTSGYTPLDIQFTDLSKNATLWNWDFGDGTNSTEQNPAHTYPTAGNYTVNLTAINVNGIDSKLATINVLKQTPIIYWYTPADITYGTALSSIQLNAVSSVPGTFIYTPTSGTVLNAGIHTLKVDFTPTDTAKYSTASTDVEINVLTPVQKIQQMTTTVQGLVTSGLLTNKESYSLISDLNIAINDINAGNTKKAIDDLSNFIKNIDNDVKTGKLSLAQGNALIDDARSVINALKIKS